MVTSGAAFHGSAANDGQAAYFLLTIEVNSAVVQEVESHTAEGTIAPPGGTNGPDGTPSAEAD